MNLKMSEALLAGAKQSLPGTGAFIIDMTDTRFACALGAIGIGLGYVRGESCADLLTAHFGKFLKKRVTPPRGGRLHGQHSIAQIIIYLNDIAGWTREQIAAWIATLEAEEEAAAKFWAQQQVKNLKQGLQPLEVHHEQAAEVW